MEFLVIKSMDNYVTLEIPKTVEHILSSVKSEHNKSKILEYAILLEYEINPSDSHIKNIITVLCRFCSFHDEKRFEDVKREDVLDSLQSFRKSEVKDPQHQWIVTYNLYLQYLLRFFRWIHFPHLPQKKRPRPAIMQNIFPNIMRLDTLR